MHETNIKHIDISIIVPILNEENNLFQLHSRLKSVLNKINKVYEIIFVNDGSTDNSFNILKEQSFDCSKTYYINLSRNFGHQIAVSAGLEYCNGNCAVIIDGDLQDPPEVIEQLYNEYSKGFHVVYAKRIKREGETFLKKITAKWFYRILDKMVPFQIPLDTGDFRILDRKLINALNKMPEQNKFIRGQVAWLGFKSSEILYERNKREHGKSGYSYSKMMILAVDAITGFSDKPLRLVSRIGFLISLLSFFVILFAIFSHFILKQTITGWTSLIISSMFLGGIQLFSIGIICEYLARINRDVKNRPLYIIDETNIN
ncbi:glycosyltransferase family 2 protein [Aquimarina agarivorans]|uniref:glycosyltransferase family 2 protein n=1 Tax=Aquimarina agarivorans TaxID=980584 RepID=UPI000248E981|nr:glycosyltransferase family 2 protein [Aquimarina agarivorans]